MKKILFYLLLISYLFFWASEKTILAQAYIADNIFSEIVKTENANNYFDIYLLLHNSESLDSLKFEFEKRKILVSERPKKVIQLLRNNAEKVQKKLIYFINLYENKNTNSFKNLRQYWIANIITLSAKPELILQLAEKKEIELISLNNGEIVMAEPVESHMNVNKSQNGAEPGIYAINAPAMWAIGYTGRNRIAMGVDTGVNFKHKALKKRFLGNHLPLTQCWMAYNYPYPVDISGHSHGTHTTGTMCGLDAENNDTIGVAYNAYWIHADPIVSNLADVRPLELILMSFEWAINPDGDINTNDDIPDVINNSWGYYVDNPPEISQCNSVESFIIDACEAAGVAIVFSAGNTGPEPGSLHEPQLIAKSLLNTFTVGSLNGNTSGLTISSFSSRGPTICADTGSLSIKPEVSAPGQDVRSAQGTEDYGTLSGTSMAAPHVSGAVLLLKEAYPFLTGTEILEALYYSANDLGDPGEDNTYGMGIIDVFAAYNYLSMSHTPVPPASPDWDISINEVLNPNFSYTCFSEINPQIVIQNNGQNTISTASITVMLNNLEVIFLSLTEDILAGETDTVTFTGIPLTLGSNIITFKITLDTIVEELDIYNNRGIVELKRIENQDLPIFEDFENIDLLSNSSPWFSANYDYNKTWQTDSTSGITNSFLSANLNCYDYMPRNGQIDDLISPLISVPESGQITLTYKVAYRKRVSVKKDSLKIYVSTDCGNSFEYLLYANGGESLTTVDGIASGRFVPQQESDWRKDTIDLSQFAGSNEILIKFSGINDNGNDLYLDNINIFAGASAIEGDNFNKDIISIFPNPAQNQLFVNYNLNNKTDSRVLISDLSGKTLQIFNLKNRKSGQLKLDISKLKPGFYFVNFENQS